MFCRGRQRNVPKCKTHVQSDCFSSLSLCFVALSLPSPSCFPKVPNDDEWTDESIKGGKEGRKD